MLFFLGEIPSSHLKLWSLHPKKKGARNREIWGIKFKTTSPTSLVDKNPNTFHAVEGPWRSCVACSHSATVLQERMHVAMPITTAGLFLGEISVKVHSFRCAHRIHSMPSIVSSWIIRIGSCYLHFSSMSLNSYHVDMVQVGRVFLWHVNHSAVIQIIASIYYACAFNHMFQVWSARNKVPYIYVIWYILYIPS